MPVKCQLYWPSNLSLFFIVELSLLFPIILYSTYGVLQCNKFGRKTKETLTGFYKLVVSLKVTKDLLKFIEMVSVK